MELESIGTGKMESQSNGAGKMELESNGAGKIEPHSNGAGKMELESNGCTEDRFSWCTSGGDRHDWQRWHQFTPVKKYRCAREGCGFFKKCWLKCNTSDTSCNGCHVIGHKRW